MNILRPSRTFSRVLAFLKCAPLAATLFATAPACAQQGVFTGIVEKVDVMDGVWMTISNATDTQDFQCGAFSEQCDWNGCSQLGRKIKVAYKFVAAAAEEDPLGDRNEIQRMEWLPASFDQELNQALCEAQKASRDVKPNAAKINSLGVWYERGLHGLQKNAQKALQYYEIAANYGNALAMHNIGDLYRQGKGVQHNGATAFEWYQKAAQAGHAIGLEDMGDCYLDGIGVAQNRDEAVRLYRQAAKRGRKSAAQKLHRLGE